MAEERYPLAPPKVEPKVYPLNPIRIAVCELRFPTLVELEERGPAAIQRRLRKSYPHYEPGTSVQIVPGRSVLEEKRYLFRTRARDYTVSLRASAMALETTSYADYASFEGRLKEVLDSLLPLLDTDFFTRVGLRYINQLPVGSDSPAEWVNPALVGPLVQGIYGRVNHYRQEVHGEAKRGRYTFRHGYNDLSEAPEYTLDFDFFDEDIEANVLFDRMREWNAECYQFFEWTIGEKARAWMARQPMVSIQRGDV